MKVAKQIWHASVTSNTIQVLHAA